MGQFTQNGVIYEEMPNGKVRVVGYAQGSGAVPLGGPDPMKPLDIAGKSLANQRTQQEINAANATAASTAAKAKSDAEIARINALNAQEQYNAQHPPVSTSGIYGTDYLKTLSPSDQAMVRALDEGRQAFPQGSALRSPFWQEKLSQVAQYDPNFDATNFNARAKARANVISGKIGQSNNALNTAMGHLATLKGQIDGTASHGGMLGLATTVNAIENAYLKGSGDPGVTNFKDTAAKLADELEAVYRNGGGAEQGVVRQLQSLDVNASREQKLGVIHNAMDLLASKMAANLSQYNFGMSGKPTWDMLDPHAKDILDNVAPDIRDKYFAAPSAPPGGSAGGGGAPPPTGPTGGIGPSVNGYNETPDPQSAQFWSDAARQGTSYRDALAQWRGDVRARGLVGVRPPPPGAYHKAAAYIRDHPDVPYQPFQSVTRAPIDPLQQVATDAAFSGPGVGIGHTVNALAATFPTALAGEQGARYNAVSNALHPNYALAGDIAGTVGGAVGAGKLVKGAAARFGLTASPARAAITGDLLYGGSAGAAQNPDNPLLGAGEGMAAMAAGNAAGRYLLSPLIRGGARAFNRTAKAFGAAPPDIPASLDPGQSLVFNRANPILGQIRTNMQDAAGLNLPYSLADASPQLRALAGSAVRKSPDVRALAESVISPRQMGQGERAIGMIDQHLAPVGDVSAMKADALARAQAASAPLYAKAMSHPAPSDRALKEMLDTPAGQQAARNAYDIALNKGENPAELSFATGPNGEPIINANPNWKTLQYVKMGLDKVVTDNQNPVTGKLDLRNPANVALNDLRARFVGRLGEINPDYRAANDAYSSIIGEGSAAERGAAATSPRVTPEQAQIAVTNAGNHLPHFQRGYASNMADQVERSRLSGDPYNLIYGSMGQQAKVGTVFPEGARAFDRARSLEGDMSKTAYETLGGSPTASRMEADRLFENPLADAGVELGIMAATGVPPKNLIMSGLRKAADARNLGFRGAKGKADKIGPLLLNADPAANLAALDELTKLYGARQAYIGRTRAMGGMFGSPLLGGPLIYGQNQ